MCFAVYKTQENDVAFDEPFDPINAPNIRKVKGLE
jgi:hypothetical protein